MPRNIKHPDCCQARIFCSFGGHGANYGHARKRPVSAAELDEWLGTQIRRTLGKTFISIVLNDRQKPLFEDTIQKHGFKLIASKQIYSFRQDMLHYYLRVENK